MYTAEKMLEIARAEIGYKEKASNTQLDDKTANAGDKNWTKYARDLHAAGYYQAPKNGYAWCDMWVDWLFMKLAGSKEKGEWLECQTGLYGAGCEWSSNCYRWAGRFDNNPQVGDQIFFGKAGAEEHTGIVEAVDDTYVYTIEGNTSNMVARRKYRRDSDYIVGYGHPRYDEEPATVKPTYTGTPSTSADAEKIWKKLCEKIGNEYGVAALMGNLQAESNLQSDNMENAYQSKLGKTDKTYTEAVDNGSYDNFIRDAVGYGLAQWTYWSRKEALLKAATVEKKSIGDWQMQVDFMLQELQTGYKSVWTALTTATDIRSASDVVLKKYENPANQSEAVQTKRASYGQAWYDKFATKKPEPKPEAPAKPAEPVKPAELKVGDIIEFTGSKHYSSSNAPSGYTCKPGKAKITIIAKGAKHPYHVVKVSGGGSTVHGWVDAADIKGATTEPTAPAPVETWTPKVGDIVNFKGNAHCVSAYSKTGKPCKPGKAKITEIHRPGKVNYPYHLVAVSGGSTVYGWVARDTFEKA